MTQNEEEQEQPFISHLIELRNRLLKVVLSVLLVFLCMAPFANEIYSFLAKPLMQFLPENTSMVAIDVISPFLTPFKLVLIASIFSAIPVILYQFWAFVAPGLYAHEKRMIAPLLVASTLLFAAGMAFAYFVVFPLVFGFLTTAVPVGVTMMTDIAKYLDFVLTMFFAFGMAFEVPIVTIVLVWAGIFTPQQLAEKRPYIIVGAFIVGMFLTPPDAISQTLLAVPIWLLFESGLLFSRLFVKKQGQKRIGSQ
ncbi:MAG: twin-arginine translocase subunit TatC [Methyloprofundus sp.]|nr:twin-arginine translocase subunit TatC [Methyloprofundus sp.]